VNTLLKTRKSGKTDILPELAQIAESTNNLETMLSTVLEYVDNVLNDRVAPDNSVGRNLLKLVQAVPKMSRGDMDNMLNTNIKVNIGFNII